VTRRELLGALGSAAAVRSLASGQQTPGKIQQLDLLHLSHTDFGFTDQPAIARELHRRFLDIAVDACLATAKEPDHSRFHWTAESMIIVSDWWHAASPARREQMLSAIRGGQLDVNAIACNNSPFMNADQWKLMLSWVPDDVWRQLSPAVGMQDDANGFPRAGAMRLLDRGITRFLMGLNTDSGGTPFPRPTAFWWKMPDGRRLFVFISEHYGAGLNYFAESWRSMPSPRAADGMFRAPRPGEILAADEDSVRKAHARCLKKLQEIEAGGYSYPRLLISMTNQWRYDNDPPFPAVTKFVATWNRLGLEPRLRLTTAGVAMREMEKIAGGSAPEHTGEWTDFWANGTMCAPREVAASRLAKRCATIAKSEVWGPMTPGVAKAADQMLRDLVLFDEHTWGSSDSISMPWTLDSQAQFAAKAMLAFGPMSRGELLVAERMHALLDGRPEGLYVVNPAPPTNYAFSGWVRFAQVAFGHTFDALQDPASGALLPVDWQAVPAKLAESYEPVAPGTKAEPKSVGRVWVEGLPAGKVLHLTASDRKAAEAAPVESKGQWPESRSWPGMKQPLFESGFGDFLVVQANTTRGVVARLAAGGYSAEEQAAKRREVLIETKAEPDGDATIRRWPQVTEITQKLIHPRLRYAERELTIWEREPRVRLRVRIYRLESDAPESFYVNFLLPQGGGLPTLSNGGVPFVPFEDQLGACCRDYVAIDSWARYRRDGAGDWLWVTRDAPLVTVGGPNTLARVTRPEQPNRLLAMVFNNHWHTNFLANESGAMEFQFDLVWKEQISDPAALANTLITQPPVLVNPAAAEDPIVRKRLYVPEE
jgi:hypothetical protein